MRGERVKSLAHFVRNARTAIRDPEILQRWIQYQWAIKTGRKPALRLGPGTFAGFPNFNAFLAAAKYPPSELEILFLKRSLQDARTIIDVGANYGGLTVLMCDYAKNANAYAFEPHPQTFATLVQNVDSNGLAGRVQCIQSAVGASIGSVAFSDTGDPATNRIVFDHDETIQVALTTIDAFVRERRLPSIDFLKIDVEGAELDVLRGADASFENGAIRCGMIEICPGNLERFGKAVIDLKAFFDAHGYDLRWYGPGGRAVVPVSADLPKDFLGNAAFLSRRLT